MTVALVTGGGGFLGAAIVDALCARGDKVRILARGAYPHLVARGVECFRGKVEDPDSVYVAMKGVDAVFHVAAQTGVWGARANYFVPNVVGTQTVVDACRKLGILRLVYTSSPSVVFGRDAIEGGDESLLYPRKYLAHYPSTKAKAERLVLGAHEPSRLHTVALRPHLIYGPNDTSLVPRLLERAKTGQVRRVGSGNNRVSVTYVKNAASAHLAALDAIASPTSVAGGKAYFVNDAEPVLLWDFVGRILEIFAAPPIDRSIPISVAYALGAALELAYKLSMKQGEPQLTRFVALQLGLSHWFRIDRAMRDLSWRPPHETGDGLLALMATAGSASSATERARPAPAEKSAVGHSVLE